MIQLEHLDRAYMVGGQTVYGLHNVDIEIPDGDYLSIMGPSGSGKSTLLNVIGLLDRPTRGIYCLDHQNITNFSDDEASLTRLRTFGFVFQSYHLIPRLTAAENIELPLMLANIPRADRKERVAELLQQLSLQDRAHHRPGQLSGGQSQRVAIARAIAMNPQVLLADEPTGNLDQSAGSEVIELLEVLNQSGLTLLVVTHDPVVGDRARRRLKLIDGEIVSDQR